MTQPTDMPIELLERPEPHFPEGRELPRTGWKGWMLWLILAAMLAGAMVAAFWTEMVVDIPLDGSVVSGPDEEIQIVLLADAQAGSYLEVGQPVRLKVHDATGWGVIVKLTDMDRNRQRRYVKAVVSIIGPEDAQLLDMVAGQACEGHVLVGFTSVSRGLWRLATNQPPRPTRRGAAELHQRIPPKLRGTSR